MNEFEQQVAEALADGELTEENAAFVRRFAPRVAAALQEMWSRGASTQRYGNPTHGALSRDFADVVRALRGGTGEPTP